jgi:hypothetical protein
MTEAKEKIDERIIDTINTVLKARLASVGFERAEVHAGDDHDGDPVLFIDAYYRFSRTPFNSDAVFGLIGVLRDALEAIGETRFPHLRHHFHEKQQVAQ